MSFSWVESITANTTTIKASHISELKTNIQTERGKRGLAAPSWTRTPVAGDVIEQGASANTPDFLDLRYYLDQAYDANWCQGHWSTHYGTVQASNYDYYSAYNASYNGSANK